MRKKRGKTLNREKIIDCELDYELQIEIFFEEYILSLHILYISISRKLCLIIYNNNSCVYLNRGLISR